MSSTPNPPTNSSFSPHLPAGYEDWKKSSVSPVLLTTLAELARVAARGASTEALLAELTQLTMLATAVDGAGAMSCADTTVTFVHADSPRTSKIDQLQEELQQGPCRTSVQIQEPVAVRDFASSNATQQWPDLAPAALQVGLHSTLAVPLLARGQAWGVLDIYRDQPYSWTFADLLVSKTLADVVVSLLVLTTDLASARASAHISSPRESFDDSPDSDDDSGDTGFNVRADLLQATLTARLTRLNTRLNATRSQLPQQHSPASEE